MKNLVADLRAYWDARAPRERAMLAALAALIVFALLAQLLWSSHQARTRLKKQIPLLSYQLEALQRKAADLQQLRGQPVPASADRNGLLASAVAKARSAGLPEVAASLQQEAPGRLRLRGAVPFDRWLAWVASLQQDGALRLVSCKVESSDAAGTAKIDALFSLPGAE